MFSGRQNALRVFLLFWVHIPPIWWRWETLSEVGSCGRAVEQGGIPPWNTCNERWRAPRSVSDFGVMIWIDRPLMEWMMIAPGSRGFQWAFYEAQSRSMGGRRWFLCMPGIHGDYLWRRRPAQQKRGNILSGMLWILRTVSGTECGESGRGHWMATGWPLLRLAYGGVCYVSNGYLTVTWLVTTRTTTDTAGERSFGRLWPGCC